MASSVALIKESLILSDSWFDSTLLLPPKIFVFISYIIEEVPLPLLKFKYTSYLVLPLGR